MNKFKATVVIECETQEQADEVLAERFGFDEDYGFEYIIDWWKTEPVEEGGRENA